MQNKPKASKIGPREQQLREMREKNFAAKPKGGKLTVVKPRKSSGRGR